MKKIALFALLLCFGSIYSQKKKKTEAVIPNIVITKSGNASAEISKNNFYLFVTNGVKKDTLLLKKYDVKGTPTLCSIKNYTTKGTPMYYVTWTENNIVETKLKKEETTVVESQIWNPGTKILQIANTYSTTKIKEIVFLDKLKTASETQERTRKSGYEFVFLGEDFSLKDKSSDTKYTYNTTSMRYEVAKPNIPVATKPTKKKRK
ncbi:MAG: hypothetical protein ABI549_04385 [Flavobacterium sp.]|uniref:hypothetical protein n=1 Tax=Flavobacterium sp. TaxID=239 RepID=UPI003267DE7E